MILNRLNFQIKNVYGETGISNSKYLTEAFRRNIFLEITDLLLEKTKNIRLFDDVLKKICEILELSFEETMTFYEQYTPVIEKNSRGLIVGRLGLVEFSNFRTADTQKKGNTSEKIIYNSYTKRIIEKITSCILHDESCLLVGDTGCGKTTIAQHVAEIFGKELHVYNLSQGSDSVDLIGGFKPVDMKIIIRKLLEKFLKLLSKIVNEKSNEALINYMKSLYQKKLFDELLKGMIKTFDTLKGKLEVCEDEDFKQKMLQKNQKLSNRVQNIFKNRDKIDTNLVFDFVEGNLIKAIK